MERRIMQPHDNRHATAIAALGALILASLACGESSSQAPSPPPPITQIVAVTQVVPVTQMVPITQIVPATMPVDMEPEIILHRLNVSFIGLDGHKLIGSGCPGTDGKGAIVDYHLIVSNVAEDRQVQRIIVAGDNSTLTWEWPCSKDWALSARDLGNGTWDLFIAPSLPSQVYTVMVFYEDDSFALGMDIAH